MIKKFESFSEKDEIQTIFVNKFNPTRKIIIYRSKSSGEITKIDNPKRLYFPYLIGQKFTQNIDSWACNNDYFINGEDKCPEKKIMGVKISDIPNEHILRKLYPNKFK